MPRLLLVALALLYLAACGGGEGSDEAAAPGGEVVEVSVSDFAIEPSSLALEPGSYTFRVVNDGGAVHALEVEGPTGEVETEELEPGESADLAVDLEDGEYELYCPVGDHRDRGMEGTLTVGAGGGGPTTDETTTEDSDYRY
jgi:plastocyanin